MKRFDITELASGRITHSYQADHALPPQPEWGDPSEYQVVETDISGDVSLRECLLNREKAYPPLGDFADAMFHASQGDDSKLQAYFAECQAVKERYPKP